jgi:hypothetical protein
LCPIDPKENEPWRVKLSKAASQERVSPRQEFFADKRKLGWPDSEIQAAWEERQTAKRLEQTKRQEKPKRKRR